MSRVFNVELRLILSTMLLVMLVDHAYQGHGHHGHGLARQNPSAWLLSALATADGLMTDRRILLVLTQSVWPSSGLDFEYSTNTKQPCTSLPPPPPSSKTNQYMKYMHASLKIHSIDSSLIQSAAETRIGP